MVIYGRFDGRREEGPSVAAFMCGEDGVLIELTRVTPILRANDFCLSYSMYEEGYEIHKLLVL